MAEVAPAGGGPNRRLFIIIAAGLVGLLVLGLIAAGGIFLISQTSKPAVTPTKIAVVTTATRVTVLATSQPTVPPTDAAPPTATLVNVPVTPAPTNTASAPITSTVAVTKTVSGTPAGGTLPTTGLGEDLLLLAAGVVLVLVIIAARRVRTAGAA